MDFRNSTRNKKIEHWLIVVLISSLCLGLNFFVSKSNWQVDLSSETRYSLSRESIALLNKLQEPVEIIVTIKEKNNLPKFKAELRSRVSSMSQAERKKYKKNLSKMK